MGIHELSNVKPEKQLAKIDAVQPITKSKDVVCRIAKGDIPNTIVMLDGDDQRPRLATIGIDASGSEAHLGLTASPNIIDKPDLLGIGIQIALAEAGVELATIRPG